MEELEKTTAIAVAERDKLKADFKEVSDELNFIKAEMGTSREAIEARRLAEIEKEKAHKRALEEWQQKFDDAEEAWNEEREALEVALKVTESRLKVAEAAAAAAGEKDEDEVDEAVRIVPKGQGVL